MYALTTSVKTSAPMPHDTCPFQSSNRACPLTWKYMVLSIELPLLCTGRRTTFQMGLDGHWISDGRSPSSQMASTALSLLFSWQSPASQTTSQTGRSGRKWSAHLSKHRRSALMIRMPIVCSTPPKVPLPQSFTLGFMLLGGDISL